MKRNGILELKVNYLLAQKSGADARSERSKSTRGRDFFAAQDRKTLSARHEKQFEALGPHKSKMRSKADLKVRASSECEPVIH